MLQTECWKLGGSAFLVHVCDPWISPWKSSPTRVSWQWDVNKSINPRINGVECAGKQRRAAQLLIKDQVPSNKLDRSVGFKTRGRMCLAQNKQELQGMKSQNSEPQQSTSLPQAPNVPVPVWRSCWTERNGPGSTEQGRNPMFRGQFEKKTRSA